MALAPACSPATVESNKVERSPAGLDLAPLTIQSKSGTHKFTVEVARTAQQQELGMMFRQSLDPDKGMLFLKERPENTSIWMKNTLIPLDIVFIRPDGTIARIEANAVPLSLDPMSSLEPVDAVLEIAGGRTAELGIEAGDKVEWAR